MTRPGLIRGLRIAGTAFFGVLCVLLIVFWVRSTWSVEKIMFDIAGRPCTIGSLPGSLVVGFSEG